ncbi:MAG: GNAT family N-acetyltransferase [Chloroflexi bacterium]|nr:GNAT family N-acetyltransferase [Chloroflexota bacterium]
MKDILKGQLVRLSAVDPEELGKAYANWKRDSELNRLFDTSASGLHSAKASSAFFEKMVKDESPEEYYFSIRMLEDNRLLGDINLDVVNNWLGRNAFVGIGIADRNDWGKGYGTDAMKVMLRYAFTEVNLNRVTLTVFEYNPRAIRSYEKVGFQHEGRQRARLLKDGKRWDMLFMGILREEWQALQ